MLKKLLGVFLIVIGIFLSVASLKMIFVDTPKKKAALKEAVYVGEDEIAAENDGKTVIVCGKFELTQPAYDDELGLVIDSIRVTRSEQTMQLKKETSKTKELTEEEKKYGVLKWTGGLHNKSFTGEGKVGDYTLSQDFIDKIRINKVWDQYDEKLFEAAGYEYVPDQSFTQKHFIEPLKQTLRKHKKNDVRYFYEAADFKTGQMVTAIGIQDGQMLKAATEVTDNLLQNALDREEAIKQTQASGMGVNIFSVVISLLLLAGGVVVISKK